MLSSLLGGRDQNALVGAIARYTGVTQSPISSLLGMLAPVVMGMIAHQPGATQPGRIASLLNSQKDNIAAALPSGLSNQLSGTGLLDALGGAPRTAAATSGRAVSDTRRRAVSNNWLWWLIPAAALAGLLVYFLTKPPEQVAQPNVTTVGQRTVVSATDVGKQVTDNLSNLHQTLSGVTGTASAQAALPKLREAAAQIDKAQSLSGQLSSEQRKVVAGLVNPIMPSLNQLFDKVLAIPGVSAELKPAVDAIKAKLAVLTA